jgi:hypothetical protein
VLRVKVETVVVSGAHFRRRGFAAGAVTCVSFTTTSLGVRTPISGVPVAGIHRRGI